MSGFLVVENHFKKKILKDHVTDRNQAMQRRQYKLQHVTCHRSSLKAMHLEHHYMQNIVMAQRKKSKDLKATILKLLET